MSQSKYQTLRNIIHKALSWKVENAYLAVFMVLLVVVASGLEAAYVQVETTNRAFSADLLAQISFLRLLALDMLLPLTVALLSPLAFALYLIAQCFLSVILLHYTIFFYNTLTLATIYHSMQGAASLGIDIFGFARWEIIFVMGLLLGLKLFLVHAAMVRRLRMPRAFSLRGAGAVCLMTVASWLLMDIYGRTGLSQTWVDFKGHRPAAERRLEEGARESVESIGYVATWLGEFFSGNYKDTTLIYAEAWCADPDGGACRRAAGDAFGGRRWGGLPLPPLPETVVMIQAESLDFDILDMRVNGLVVTPFLNYLARRSLVLDVFAPHKVASCNSDYELLNGRVADQNVVYYTYIKNYPDSAIRLLKERGYRPAFFHGLGGGLFNLREAYSLQGFEEFHFKEELLNEGYKGSSLIMEHVLDEDVFKSAARALEGRNGPTAQFIVTMSSHVPFMKAAEPFKRVGGSFARYVTSLNYLDGQLADFYQKLPEGALLIIWGDHGSDVSYLKGFGPGRRHVPFIVHVKGGDEWVMESRRQARQEQDREWQPSLAIGQGFSLCELSYYLGCLFSGQ